MQILAKPTGRHKPQALNALAVAAALSAMACLPPCAWATENGAASRTVSGTASGPASGPASTASAPHPFKLPPQVELRYSITARQRGIPLSGQGLLIFRVGGGKYSVASETRATLLGKLQESRSEGGIDAHGLAPLEFTEKRFRKDPTTTRFQRDSNRITFSEGTQSWPIHGGEQDRTSALWQLLALARAAPERFIPGSEWVFMVAGRRDAEPWRFRVERMEDIALPQGKTNALHLVKAPPPNAEGQRLDVWLAPGMEWYPVRLRFSDSNGDYVEQILEKVGTPPTPPSLASLRPN